MSDFDAGFAVGKLEARIAALENAVSAVSQPGVYGANKATKAVPDPIVHEESITVTKGQALLLDIQRADNEITVVLDGIVKYYEHFWERVRDTFNFSGIDEGQHVLVISVDNHGYPVGSSISRIEFKLHHHDQVEHVNEKTHSDYRQGLVYQYIYVITVERPDE